MNSFKEWFFDSGQWILGVVAIAALLTIAVVAMNHEHAEWMRFRDAHRCRVAGKMDGDVLVGSGISSSGKAVMTTSFVSAKEGWLCDDGITYWKDAP